MPAKTAPSDDAKTTKTRANRKNFTERWLNGLLRSRPQRQTVYWDEGRNGLCALVSRGPKDGRRATILFRVRYNLKSQPGKLLYIKIGRYPDGYYKYPYKAEGEDQPVTISCGDLDAVRDAAADIRTRAAVHDLDPHRVIASDAFADVVEDFIELYVKNHRTWKETKRIFDTYVIPEWQGLKIGQIKRSTHITPLLEKVARKQLPRDGRMVGGKATAEAVLTALTTLFNWQTIRDENFRSPMVKGMRKALGVPSTKERARARVLSDDELRIMWPILDTMGSYGAAVKCVLLTAQRARKVIAMKRADVKAHLVIPSHKKNNEVIPEQRMANVWDATRDDDPENKRVSVVPLSRQARQIIDSVPVVTHQHRPLPSAAARYR